MIPLKRLFSAVLIAAFAAVCDGRETQQETPIRIAITLQDSSRILGEPSQDTLPFNTAYAEIKLPLSSLDTVEFPTNREFATIRLRNGDKLQGVFNFKTIDLKTLFGKVSLEIQSIIRIENITKHALADGQDLLEHYPFDGNAHDESGNAKHGTIHGNTDFGDGKSGKAVQFHNPETSSPFDVRDYIALPKVSVTQFTVSHWVKFNSDTHPHDCVTYSIGTHVSADFFWIHITQSGLISSGLNVRDNPSTQQPWTSVTSPGI